LEKLLQPLMETAATEESRPEPPPEQVFEQTTQRVRQACVARRFTDVSAAAARQRTQCGERFNCASLMRVLSEATPSTIEAPGDQRLWMLQRFDGEMLALVQLCGDGVVSRATHPNEARWHTRDGRLMLATPEGETTTTFTLGATWRGRRVMIGLFKDERTVHVLTEVDCAYSRLRVLEPELAGELDSMFAPGRAVGPPLPPRPAMLLAAPRTGSQLLLNLLNSSGRVLFDAELMSAAFISMFGANVRHKESSALYAMRANDPRQFLRIMLSRSHHSDGRLLDDVPVRGFKLLPRQSEEALDWALAEPSLRTVHLYRANLLAEYSSLLLAHANEQWIAGPTPPKTRQIRFRREFFLRFVAQKNDHIARMRERLAQAAGPSTEIEYSSFAPASVNRVLGFLLDEPCNAALSTLGLRRQQSEKVIDRFTNPDDALRCLAAIGHEDWAGVERPAISEL
jgi:hypothetical protein